MFLYWIFVSTRKNNEKRFASSFSIRFSFLLSKLVDRRRSWKRLDVRDWNSRENIPVVLISELKQMKIRRVERKKFLLTFPATLASWYWRMWVPWQSSYVQYGSSWMNRRDHSFAISERTVKYGSTSSMTVEVKNSLLLEICAAENKSQVGISIGLSCSVKIDKCLSESNKWYIYSKSTRFNRKSYWMKTSEPHARLTKSKSHFSFCDFCFHSSEKLCEWFVWSNIPTKVFREKFDAKNSIVKTRWMIIASFFDPSFDEIR